jgi:hypothetical protein
MALYDFIYVDRQKIISLYSQLTGGVVEVRESSSENSSSADNKRNYDFKVFKHDAGGTTQEKNSDKETIKPHHALILELESELQKQGYLLDLTRDAATKSFRNPAIRSQLKTTMCVKVRGRAVIEDYERIKNIASVFPEVAALISKSAESNYRATEEFTVQYAKLVEAENEAKSIKDGRVRSTRQRELKTMRESFETAARSRGVASIEPWILDGLRTWVDAFLPGINNLRLYSQGSFADEHVFGHLKKDCLEDSDSNSLHFTYGSLPTEDLTLLGIVTSVPDEDENSFQPLAEFNKDELKDFESIERAFRGMFRGFDGLEKMIRTSRYPRVLVYPLTVYREVSPNKSLATT